MARSIHFVLMAGLAGLLPACSPAPLTGPPSEAAVGLDLAGRDLTVAPGDDFFAYANGGWSAATEIPADRSSTGTGLEIYERTEERLAELIAGTAAAPDGTLERKIADYFATYLDEASIDARGTEPLAEIAAEIAAIEDRGDLASYLGRTLRTDVDAFNNTDHYTDHLFGLWVAQDLDGAEVYVPFLMQGGLDMPNRAFYLDDSEPMEANRAACRAHVANLLRLLGLDDVESRAGRVFELERRMAAAHWTREDSGEIAKGNNSWTRPAFAAEAPGLDWDAYFTAAGLADQPTFIVWQPSAVAGLAALAGGESLDTWKDYLLFHAADHYAAVLPRAFREERFDFHERILSGTPEMLSRRRQAIAETSEALGEEVGRLYVERYFPPADKARIEAMVENIKQAFRRRIEALDWMAPATKTRALEKLVDLRVSVGYPEQWRDPSSLEIVAGDALGNAMRSELFSYRTAVAKLGRPADRGEWVMTPQTVNAVNLPVLNAMNFPAGILQPPLFDPRRAAAMDYGAIGAVIGHEIVHSFDDQGAKFGDGRLTDWWTRSDLDHFQAAGEELVVQYDAYRPFPDAAVNGRLTQGENIADLAGLAASYDAYRLSLAGSPAPEVGGLTGDQQFFLAYAECWRSKQRQPLLRQRLVGDSHAPPMYRVATVRNLDPWYDAFGVTEGQEMYLAPEDRVRIW